MASHSLHQEQDKLNQVQFMLQAFARQNSFFVLEEGMPLEGVKRHLKWP